MPQRTHSPQYTNTHSQTNMSTHSQASTQRMPRRTKTHEIFTHTHLFISLKGLNAPTNLNTSHTLANKHAHSFTSIHGHRARTPHRHTNTKLSHTDSLIHKPQRPQRTHDPQYSYSITPKPSPQAREVQQREHQHKEIQTVPAFLPVGRVRFVSR